MRKRTERDLKEYNYALCDWWRTPYPSNFETFDWLKSYSASSDSAF